MVEGSSPDHSNQANSAAPAKNRSIQSTRLRTSAESVAPLIFDPVCAATSLQLRAPPLRSAPFAPSALHDAVNILNRPHPR